MILTEFDENRMVFGGCDLGTTTDLTSFAMLQRTDGKGFVVNWLFWLPDEQIERAEKRDGVPYRQWESDGYITLTKGARINHRWIKSDIVDACVAHNIAHVGYDPWNAEFLQAELEAEGIEPIQVRQGYAQLSEASKTLEAAIAEHALAHAGHPIAKWQADNVEVMTDTNGNIRPVKPAHGSSKRIDGIVAAIIAIAVSLQFGDTSTDSDSQIWY